MTRPLIIPPSNYLNVCVGHIIDSNDVHLLQCVQRYAETETRVGIDLEPV